MGGSVAPPSWLATPTGKRGYVRGDQRPGRRTRLHCRSHPRRRRNFAEPAGEVPSARSIQTHRIRRGRLWLQPEGVTCLAGTSWCSSKNLYGRPTMPRLPTSSTGVHLASSGSRSRVCTSWRRITGLCTRDGNDSWPSGWVQPHTKSKQPRSDVVPPAVLTDVTLSSVAA